MDPNSRRIKEMEVMVADVIVETPDTTTLVLFTGNDRLEYLAGHFLTIDPHQFESLERFTSFLEDLKGKREPPRAYSMSSAPHERYLAVTVKEERYVSGTTKFPPLLSPLLVKRTLRGMRLVVTGFTGPYTLGPNIGAETDHLVHVCAGSGSVPNFSMLKFALAHHPELRHTFVYSNKKWDDVIFRDELGRLAAQHPDRLRLLHTLTREEDPGVFGPSVRKGRAGSGAAARGDSEPRRVSRLRLRAGHFEVRPRRGEGSGHGAAAAVPRVGARGPEAARRPRQTDQAGVLRLAIMDSPVIASWLAQPAFWVLIVVGVNVEALSRRAAATFVALWLAGYLGLPRIAWWTASFVTSWVAALDIVLVFIVFKGDVRLS